MYGANISLLFKVRSDQRQPPMSTVHYLEVIVMRHSVLVSHMYVFLPLILTEFHLNTLDGCARWGPLCGLVSVPLKHQPALSVDAMRLLVEVQTFIHLKQEAEPSRLSFKSNTICFKLEVRL